MSYTSKTVEHWTCDRCAATAEGTNDVPPQDWQRLRNGYMHGNGVRVTIQGIPEQTDLCPACVEGLRDWWKSRRAN